MGIFSRVKQATKAKANAAIEKRMDPAKEIDLVIEDLEAQHRSSLKELLSFKASSKQMEQQVARQTSRATDFEKKAMIAVRKGDEELAKKLLRASKQCVAEIEQIGRDRNEAAGYAVELNRTRKQVEQRLKILKLKRGTMAAQIAAARGKQGFGIDADVFARFDEVENAIEDEAIAAEVQAALDGDMEGEHPGLSELPSTDAEDELKALKKKMADKA